MPGRSCSYANYFPITTPLFSSFSTFRWSLPPVRLINTLTCRLSPIYGTLFHKRTALLARQLMAHHILTSFTCVPCYQAPITVPSLIHISTLNQPLTIRRHYLPSPPLMHSPTPASQLADCISITSSSPHLRLTGSAQAISHSYSCLDPGTIIRVMLVAFRCQLAHPFISISWFWSLAICELA